MRQKQYIDFTECDLKNSIFDNGDLAGAIFADTVMGKTDFRTSFNFSIDPENSKRKKARFSKYGFQDC